jgi:DNA-binding NtrC family response regulator
MPEPILLFIDDDENFRKLTAYDLTGRGYQVLTAENGQAGLSVLAKNKVDVILCDLKMPVMDGLSFLKSLHQEALHPPVIVVTAFGTVENAVQAMKSGAVDYITKPVNRDELYIAIERVLDHQRLKHENRKLRRQLSAGSAADRLIGSSGVMKNLRETLLKLAESDAPILLRGESGVGKELAARSLHYDGPRSRRGQYVVLNCAAIPRELLESELFGHKKGAFTGAVEKRTGKFEAADGGTLFLDEIGDMPVELQVKLLRVLQEGEVTRIGESKPLYIDVRVIAATNQPLEEKIKSGTFRQDLYYRLSVIPLTIPPLRARLEDLPILCRHLLDENGAAGTEVTDSAMEILMAHAWPGNVRELENEIMRVCALYPGVGRINPEMLDIKVPAKSGLEYELMHGRDFIRIPAEGIQLGEVEKKLLTAAWEQTNHHQTAGAELLGMTRQAFIYRLQKYGLIPRYKNSGGDSS